EETGGGQISTLKFGAGATPEKVIEAVIKAAHKGDQLAVELLSDAGYVIGKGLAILIHIMNPEVIVLSGKSASAGEFLLASAQQAQHTYAMPRMAGATSLNVYELASHAGLIGAAALVIDNFDKIRLS